MKKKLDQISKGIIEFVKEHPGKSSSEIHDGLNSKTQLLTTKRRLIQLVIQNFLTTTGTGRGTKYVINPAYNLFIPIDIEIYFKQEVDQRVITTQFNHSIIEEILKNVSLFSVEEIDHLNGLQAHYGKNVIDLSESIYKNELERLSIDLSWKSSEIEGNTYSLLETEALLKEKKEAKGKHKSEATMLLNHKMAIDYIIEEPDYISPLSRAKIESIHSILIKDLGVERNIRKRLVGITGTNYVPIDNEFQIFEALDQMCSLVNERVNAFEKVLLLLLLISYIQPFSDGNKRTARIICNAILIRHGYCPLSFRTVDSVDYKKALLLFYEQNNILAFKDIFIQQYEFAVNTYFK